MSQHYDCIIVGSGPAGVSAALYTLAARYGCKALAMMTVSDLVDGNETGEETTAQERQTSFNDMMKIALETAICFA